MNATIGWLVTIVCFAFCIFGRRTFADPDYEYDVVWETFYSSISRPIWVIGICWIIYASIKNQAGRILSHPIRQSISALLHFYFITK